MGKFSLSKKERLKNRKHIQALFSHGSTIHVYPIRLIYLKLEFTDPSAAPLLFSVSVPKRNFKSAAMRNLFKRRIRESYRIQKGEYFATDTPKEIQYALMFIYYPRKEESFALINRSVQRILMKFYHQIGS